MRSGCPVPRSGGPRAAPVAQPLRQQGWRGRGRRRLARAQQLQIGLGLVGAYGSQRHGQLTGVAGNDAALQNRPGRSCTGRKLLSFCIAAVRLHGQISGDGARSCLRAGVDAHHLCQHGCKVIGCARHLQPGHLAHLNLYRIGRSQLSLNFQLRGVDDLDNAGLDATRSPLCTKRWAICPSMGLVMTESVTALRAASAADWAAARLARAVSRLAWEVASAVVEIKPFAPVRRCCPDCVAL